MAFATPKNDIIQLQLASAYTAGAGSLVLKTGQGANFVTFPAYVTCITNATYATGAAEVKASYVATGKSTDTLTGVSVIDGYTDINFSINDYVEERANAKYITDLNAAANTSILTVASETATPTSRKIVLATGLTPTDGGAGGNYTITPAFASLTTTGSSGAATLASGVLNVPTYSAGSGTVTTASVVSANGFAGTVANPTTTPAITLSTSITGVLKGNGTAISAAVSDTDYQAPISLTTTGSSGAATFTGNVLNVPNYVGSGGGTVTTVSVASANGFTGTVANPTSTPAITITTSITGILVGNGTAIAAATEMSQGASGELIQAAMAQPSTLVAGARWYDSTKFAEVSYRNGIVGSTPRLLYIQVSNPTFTNTTGGSLFSSTLPLPANFFEYAGKTIRIDFSGYFVSTSTTPGSYYFNTLLGGNVVGTNASTALSVNLSYSSVSGWVEVTCKSTGGTGTVDVGGYARSAANTFVFGNSSNANAGTNAPGFGTPATISTPSALSLDFQMVVTGATTNNDYVNNLLKVWEIG